MVITGIYPRRKRLTAISLDCDFLPENPRLDGAGLLVLDSEFWEEKGLKEGTEISEEELCLLFTESEKRRAKSKALWLLSRRDYCAVELKRKLLADFPAYAADFAVSRMEELGYINDEAYAEKLAVSLIEEKGNSPKVALYLMAQKGLPLELAKITVENREDDPKEGIRRIIDKKYRNRLHTEKDVARAVSALARKGYSYGDIRSVLREYTNNSEFGEY